MALTLRYVKPSFLKAVSRCYRPYSAQIDILRLDETSLEQRPREELTNYQEMVTDKMMAFLQEGKRLANCVCSMANTNDVSNQEGQLNINELINDLQTCLNANIKSHYFHFFDSYLQEKILRSEALSIEELHRLGLQSHSYTGSGSCSNKANGHLTDCDFLDQTFGVDTAQFVPPHLAAYVRENASCKKESAESKTLDIASLQEIFKLELATCQNKLLKENHLNCAVDNASGSNRTQAQPNTTSNDERPKPTKDQLIKVHELMTAELPKILLSRHDYRQYRPDVVLQNNFFDKPYTTKGIAPYVVEVAKCRMWAHFKYANVKMSLLKSSIEEDEGCVIFHWRVSGVPQIRAFMFWKFLPWTYRNSVRNESDYHEGISTFYVDNTGLIAVHQVDKTMIDREYETVDPRNKIREKLNKLLSPKPAIGAAYKSGQRD